MKKNGRTIVIPFFFLTFSGMNIDSDIFKIQSNNVLPSRGRIFNIRTFST